MDKKRDTLQLFLWELVEKAEDRYADQSFFQRVANPGGFDPDSVQTRTAYLREASYISL